MGNLLDLYFLAYFPRVKCENSLTPLENEPQIFPALKRAADHHF